MISATWSSGCRCARSLNHMSRGRIQRILSASTPWSSSHKQASALVFPAPTIVKRWWDSADVRQPVDGHERCAGSDGEGGTDGWPGWTTPDRSRRRNCAAPAPYARRRCGGHGPGARRSPRRDGRASARNLNRPVEARSIDDALEVRADLAGVSLLVEALVPTLLDQRSRPKRHRVHAVVGRRGVQSDERVRVPPVAAGVARAGRPARRRRPPRPAASRRRRGRWLPLRRSGSRFRCPSRHGNRLVGSDR